MPIAPTERLLNLVIALLGSAHGRSRDYLRSQVAGYDPTASDEAFGRMFERDKVQLRRLGIPIQSIEDPRGDGKNAWKYRIDPAEYRLPEIPLDEQGAAMLALAARVWEQASLGSMAARALRKVATATGMAGTESTGALESRIRTKEPAFDPLWEALLGRHTVRFEYRNAQTTVSRARTVQPWGLGNKYGQWYLDGLDVEAGEQRLFRLSRITSAVELLPDTVIAPADYDIAGALDRLGTGILHSAVLEVPSDRGRLLRDQATETVPNVRPGWDTVTVPYREPEMLAGELAALGDGVVVREPAELRHDVLGRLSRARAADLAPAPLADFSAAGPVRPRPEVAEDRLRRLLDLVPFLVRHSGIAFDDVAAEFDVSAQQLTKDLELLSVCGLPGYLHGDLIDVQWEDGPVWIRDADVLESPLRLTQAEACALLVGLEALRPLADAGARSILDRVLESVRRVAGSDAWVADVVEARITPNASLETLTLLQRASAASGLVRIAYFVRQRDELTDRVIEPRRVFGVDALWYVEAWCRQAQGIRNFRLDNIRSAEAVPGTAPERTTADDDGVPGTLFTPGVEGVEIVLALDAEAAQVADAYGATRRTTLADGRLAAAVVLSRPTAVPPLLAGLGGSAQLLAPEALRGSTAAWVDRALAGYGPDAP